MKQLEQEKTILSQGLEMVEKTRSWYCEQLGNVDERMKYLGTADTFGVIP